MKKVIGIAFVLLLITAQAQAADYLARWNPVDFEAVNSDLAQSGYKLYESQDNGQTKTLIGEVDANTTELSFQRDSVAGTCLYATSFNQYGESDYSEAYCVNAPAVPTIIDLLRQIVTTLREISEKMI